MPNGDSYLLPHLPDNPFPLGRAGVHLDPRNYEHRALVNPPPKRTKAYKRWLRLRKDVYDQQGPSCTAQSAIGVLRTGNQNRAAFTEFAGFDTEEERHAAYLRWQKFDPEWWGPHDGSASDSAWKGLREEGYITSWKWLFGEEELLEWVRFYAAAEVGIVWTEDMFYPDSGGFIRPSGRHAGGHEISVVGYDSATDAYELVNSWSLDWGKWGRCRIKRADMAALLRDDGDASTVG
jgi:hypothetical protein